MSDFSKKTVSASIEEMLPIIEEKLKAGGEVTFSPQGISMWPLIVPPRDSVTLKAISDGVKGGDIVFYRRQNGEFVLHRVLKVKKNGDLVLRGDNQLWKEYGITTQMVLAKAVSVNRKGRDIDFSSFGYRLYLRMIVPMNTIRVFFKIAIRKIKRTLKIK